MGKGTILSGGEAGLYLAKVVFDKVTYNKTISDLNTAISATADKIATLGPGIEKNVAKAQLMSLEKRKDYLESNIPVDKDVSVWCTDFTEDLSGEVGLIEIPGESVDFNIQPGYEANAEYNKSRDGQLVPTIVQTPAQAYYNLAMLPGWQKWKPTFRYATVTAIDGNLADISFESTKSTQQDLNVNQEEAISDVPIEYMDCDGIAFEVGDSVLVTFTGQDWNTPKIIGFKDHPKRCNDELILLIARVDYPTFWPNTEPYYCTIFDPATSRVSTEIPTNSGGLASFPCLYSDISNWIADYTSSVGNEVYWNPWHLGLGEITPLYPDCDCETCDDSVNSQCMDYAGEFNVLTNSCSKTTTRSESGGVISTKIDVSEDYDGVDIDTYAFKYESFNGISVGAHGWINQDVTTDTNTSSTQTTQAVADTGSAGNGGPLGEATISWTANSLSDSLASPTTSGTTTLGKAPRGSQGTDLLDYLNFSADYRARYNLRGSYGERVLVQLQMSSVSMNVVDAETSSGGYNIVDRQVFASFKLYDSEEDLNTFDPRQTQELNGDLTSAVMALHEAVKAINTSVDFGTQLFPSILKVS